MRTPNFFSQSTQASSEDINPQQVVVYSEENREALAKGYKRLINQKPTHAVSTKADMNRAPHFVSDPDPASLNFILEKKIGPQELYIPLQKEMFRQLSEKSVDAAGNIQNIPLMASINYGHWAHRKEGDQFYNLLFYYVFPHDDKYFVLDDQTNNLLEIDLFVFSEIEEECTKFTSVLHGLGECLKMLDERPNRESFQEKDFEAIVAALSDELPNETVNLLGIQKKLPALIASAQKKYSMELSKKESDPQILPTLIKNAPLINVNINGIIHPIKPFMMGGILASLREVQSYRHGKAYDLLVDQCVMVSDNPATHLRESFVKKNEGEKTKEERFATKKQIDMANEHVADQDTRASFSILNFSEENTPARNIQRLQAVINFVLSLLQTLFSACFEERKEEGERARQKPAQSPGS